jgi:hypothetical protein
VETIGNIPVVYDAETTAAWMACMATKIAPGYPQLGNWQRHHMIAEICVSGVIAWGNDVAKQPWLGSGVYAEMLS